MIELNARTKLILQKKNTEKSQRRLIGEEFTREWRALIKSMIEDDDYF